jgi:hypothetical protein
VKSLTTKDLIHLNCCISHIFCCFLLLFAFIQLPISSVFICISLFGLFLLQLHPSLTYTFKHHHLKFCYQTFCFDCLLHFEKEYFQSIVKKYLLNFNLDLHHLHSNSLPCKFKIFSIFHCWSLFKTLLCFFEVKHFFKKFQRCK